MCQSPTKLKTPQAFTDIENCENAGFTTKGKLSLLPTLRLSGELRALFAHDCLGVGVVVQSMSTAHQPALKSQLQSWKVSKPAVQLQKGTIHYR